MRSTLADLVRHRRFGSGKLCHRLADDLELAFHVRSQHGVAFVNRKRLASGEFTQLTVV